MDFASLMSAQIAKTQKDQPPPSSKNARSPSTTSKYMRNGEAEAAREAAYHAEQETKRVEREAKAENKRKLEEEEAERKRAREGKRLRLAEESRTRRAEEEEQEEKQRRKRLGLPMLPSETAKTPADENKDASPTPIEAENDIEDGELIGKLREIQQPARLFGESHKQRLRRYRRLTDEMSRSNSPFAGAAVAANKAKTLISTTLEPVAEEDMKVSAKLPPASDTAARLLLSRRLTSWFSLVLREWAVALASRSESTKQTFSGQAAASSMTQAIEHLKPLYRKLERSPSNPAELPDDLLSPIAEIVNAAQERRYVDANDGYLKLSIGKAAWPIGVTMVGIHERSAREKLHESDKGKAHIMADEATRKILQSIKRCLSFAQTRWPPSDVGQLMG